MVARYGMAEKLGHVTYDREQSTFLGGPAMPPPRIYSEETAHEIDMAVRDLVEGAYRKATAILTERRATLLEGAKQLLEHETLNEEDLARLVGRPAKRATAAQ